MGISKRNPRGNFNWQSRILKKKAACCGQLNEPFDCNALAPTISWSGSYVLCDNSNPVSASVSNTKPGQTTTWEWYFNGSLINSSSSYTWNLPTLADQGTYTIIATNQFGCTSHIDIYLTYVQQPIVNVSSVDPMIPACDGELYLEVSNPTPGVTYYNFEVWDIVNNIKLYDIVEGHTNYTFTGLCFGQYAYRITPKVSTPYGNILTCSSPYEYINLPKPPGPGFRLSFNNLNTIGLPNAWGIYSVTPWNAVMGTDYQMCVVDTGTSSVTFYYSPSAGSLSMNANAFTVSGLINNLTDVDDSVGDFTQLGDSAFSGCSLLVNAAFPTVVNVGVNIFSNCSALVNISMDILTYVSDTMFASCTSLNDPYLPNITSIGNGGFSSCISLVKWDDPSIVNLPNVTYFGDSVFFGCQSLTEVKATNLGTMGNACFRFCYSFQSFSAPSLTSMGNINFSGMTGLNLIDINIPSCATISSSCANNGENFQKASGVAYDPASNFTITVPASLATCNAGGPDADFAYINLFNPSVTINYV